MQVFKCHPGIGQSVEGVALVASDDFSARYDLDRIRGVFSRPAHALFGKDYRDTILVLNAAKGGVASAWMLREMASRKVCPAAFLFNRVNPILAQGAAFGGLAMVDRFVDGDITRLIKSGARVRVEPAEGRVTVL
jgi:predicted aconitase with swiveling domain